MTFDEKKKAQALVERKDKLNKEVERGGTWVWRASFAWFAGRLCFGDLGFWTQMAWGLLEVVVGFNVLPLVAALVACCVVPRAYLSTPWLCEKDEVAVNPAANAERSGLNGLAAPSGVLRDVLPRQRNAYEVDDDEETVRPGEYLNETKRVGYGRRAARANARGSRP